MSTPETPRIDELQAALDRGDLDTVRRTVLEVEGRERELLEQELGATSFGRARRAAARGRRRGKLGHVLVLPGIMGTELDSVDRKGDADRIWISVFNLLAGRIGDLELTAEGEPKPQGIHIRPAGIHRKTYVPLLLELDTRWHVRPFGFDWREDMDRSATRLDAEIKAFGGGEPVHLVAHSMGGLVSRRFAQLFPETWSAMDDPSGSGRGGRLIMLGTPNRGSFAIPLTLSGGEKIVKFLATGDIHHSLAELLAIIGSFPGLYQMLPSPLVDLDDDHEQLFDAARWGNLPASQKHLAKADKFLRDLDTVIDPHRLLYVAGVNRETPARIRIESAGKFSYKQTLDGDSRVPHELGLLPDVRTYWVDETHGDLAKNEQVLDAMTELLQTGKTNVLSTTKPPKPVTRAAPRGWQSADAVAPLPEEAERIAEKAGRRSRAGAGPQLTPEEEVQAMNLALDDYLGSGDRPAVVRGAAIAEEAPVAPEGTGETAGEVASAVAKVEVEVVWGDVTKVDADVYAVGHYQGVLPQRAELALDEAVSGVQGAKEYDRRRLVITQHAQRGRLHAALGDVEFFPWNDSRNGGRLVVIAGMGRPGTFDPSGLRQVVSAVVTELTGLPNIETVASVLVGSGEGTLTIQEAVRSYIDGISDAALQLASGTGPAFPSPVGKLVIVEYERGRAEEILEAFKAELRGDPDQTTPRPVEFVLTPTLKRGSGGIVSVEESIALVAESVLRAAGGGKGSREARALTTLLAEAGPNATVRGLALARLRAEGSQDSAATRRPRFRVERRAAEWRGVDVPTRISFWDDGQAIRAAAIHEAATVPERVIGVARDVVDDLVAKMIDPAPDDVAELCDLLYRLLVPGEFRDVLGAESLVFEVDRPLARVHWEMLATAVDDESDVVPVAVRRSLARQLRTTYSPPPVRPSRPGRQYRALVIGDPGDPDKGEDLPGARSEALKVKELLESRGDIAVDARIGAPSVPREGPLFGVKPADRLEILSLLLRGEYDLVHYAGHGDFDPQQPNRVGWLFARGLLTPGEIGRLERVPAVIVSNACLSARTSNVVRDAQRVEDAHTEAGLLPSLADEFFKLGVRNYVGTAWEVNDVGAELFARIFYGSLLEGESFGESVRRAREALWRDRETYGALWAAYQHYGDPTSDAGLAREGR